MNKDALNRAAPRAVLTVAYDGIDRFQDHPPELVVAAVAVLLKEFSSVLRIPISELLNKADRMTGDLNENYMPEISALREYIKHQMRS